MVPQARNEDLGTLAAPTSPLAAGGHLNPPSRMPQPLGMKAGESGADRKIGSASGKFMVIKKQFWKILWQSSGQDLALSPRSPGIDPWSRNSGPIKPRGTDKNKQSSCPSSRAISPLYCLRFYKIQHSSVICMLIMK